MNNYLTGIEGMPRLLFDENNPMVNFEKKILYPEIFKKYCREHAKTFEAIEAGYHEVIDKEQFLANMAAALTDKAKEKVEEQKKNKQGIFQADLNMYMAIYVLPAIQNFGGDSSKPLKEAVLRAWNQNFPKNKLRDSNYEKIHEGFQWKFCYITTAVCETFEKPDDCYELTILRNYRDGYLMSQPDGEEVIRQYYDLAPTIVKHINQRKDRQEIYRGVWETYLEPCIHMIENGQQEQCKQLYMRMVRDLKKKYFFRKS